MDEVDKFRRLLATCCVSSAKFLVPDVTGTSFDPTLMERVARGTKEPAAVNDEDEG